MKDFNGIVSQEVDKSLPIMNKKTDFLHPITNIHKTLDSDVLNNSKILMNLHEEFEKLMKRKEEITQRNYFIELKGEISDTKEKIKVFMQEIRRSELEIQKDGKKLNIIENLYDGLPESLIKCVEIEEELGPAELKLKNTIEKGKEIKKFSKENTKKEEKIRILYEETMKKANEMGFDEEKDVFMKKYRDLKKKKGYLEKDIEFLKKRNEKMEEIWAKELENIMEISENRVKKTEILEEEIEKEKEIIREMQEKDEFDEEIYRKIEELKEFGGFEGVLKRFEAKNMSFIEGTKKKLVVNSSFSSNKVLKNVDFIRIKEENMKKEQYKEEFLEEFPRIKEEKFEKKERIFEINEKLGEDVKKSYNFSTGNNKDLFVMSEKLIIKKEEANLKVISEEKEKEIPFKSFNFSKKQENTDILTNSMQKETINEALNTNDTVKEEVSIVKTFNFSKKDTPIQQNTKENMILTKPIQTKRPRNIFNSTETEEKNMENNGKILEIPEIQDFIQEKPKEKPVLEVKEEEKTIKPFKKKIEDPFEVKKVEENLDFSNKNEEKKTLNITKEASKPANLDQNNDFFQDFDF